MTKTDSNSIENLQAKFNRRIEETQKLVKQSMLAGLGVMDRSVEEINTLRNQLDEQVAELSEKGTELFNELVERGEKVQADAQANVKESRATVEKEVNERVDQLKVKVAELTEKLGVAESLESIAGTFDSLTNRFNKKA